MLDDLSRAQFYREQSENLSRMAALEEDEAVRKSLLALANQYERLRDKHLALAASKRTQNSN